MSRDYARELVRKYNQDALTASEEAQLEQYLERGLVDISELKDLQALGEQLDVLFGEERTHRMRRSFQSALEAEKQRTERDPLVGLRSFLRSLWAPAGGFNLAYGLLFLILGGAIGYLLRGPQAELGNGAEIAQLSKELRETREMVMLTMLEKESTSERLKAVNLTREMGGVSEPVAEALLKTLNNDPNTNVRLAALEALTNYAQHPRVREGLIASIERQESPLVQMALAETMAALQEKGSVKELRALMQREETAPEVKEKIRTSLEVLM